MHLLLRRIYSTWCILEHVSAESSHLSQWRLHHVGGPRVCVVCDVREGERLGGDGGGHGVDGLEWELRGQDTPLHRLLYSSPGQYSGQKHTGQAETMRMYDWCVKEYLHQVRQYSQLNTAAVKFITCFSFNFLLKSINAYNLYSENATAWCSEI